MIESGARAGNAPVEALTGVLRKIGVKTGIEFFDIADAAEDVVHPAMPAECLLDRNALIMGYSGVYSSSLKYAVRQAEHYGVPASALLYRAGRRKLIGGKEDRLPRCRLEMWDSARFNSTLPARFSESMARLAAEIGVATHAVGGCVDNRRRRIRRR